MSGRKWVRRPLCAMFICLSLSLSASADVFNMGDGLVSLEMVTVGDPGNANNAHSFGAVNYEYRISKHEVTVAQYTDFLNNVAKSDPYELYNTGMGGEVVTGQYARCGIVRSGDSGSYSYSYQDGYANRPVTFVSWADSARFVNWLHNGQGTSDTEDGVYKLYDDSGHFTTHAQLFNVGRQDGWTWAIPNKSEWHKAGYYNASTDDYYAVPTSNPDNSLPHPSGTAITDSSDENYTNAANYGQDTSTPIDVGSFPGTVSPYGTLDQAGNVWEWNEGVEGSTGANYWRHIRGGAFRYPNDDYEFTGFDIREGPHTFGNNVSDIEAGELGFRVVAAPAPVQVVPLPPSAWMAGACLFSLAGSRLLRRRNRFRTA